MYCVQLTVELRDSAGWRAMVRTADSANGNVRTILTFGFPLCEAHEHHDAESMWRCALFQAAAELKLF